MKPTLTIEIRISTETAGGPPRFTKEEVEELVKTENIVFHKNLLLRKHDGKIIGEIKGYTTT